MLSIWTLERCVVFLPQRVLEYINSPVYMQSNKPHRNKREYFYFCHEVPFAFEISCFYPEEAGCPCSSISHYLL